VGNAVAHALQTPSSMRDSKPAKRLSLKKETLRSLLDNELQHVNGAYACSASKVSATCSTATIDKCPSLGAQAKTLCG
jgi:hypothetical protein